MGYVRFVAAARGVVSDGVPIAADWGPHIRLPRVRGRPGPRPNGLVRIGVCKGTCSFFIRFPSSTRSIRSPWRHSFARKAHVHHSPTACVQEILSSGSCSFGKGNHPGLTLAKCPIEPKFDWKLRSGSRKPRGPPGSLPRRILHASPCDLPPLRFSPPSRSVSILLSPQRIPIRPGSARPGTSHRRF